MGLMSMEPATTAEHRSAPAHLPHAIVIGSGFGGLAAAVRLGARGYRVTVLEKLDAPGGRGYVYRQDGFTFDAGPTIITAPFILDELWSLAGAKFSDDVTLKPLDPAYIQVMRIGSALFAAIPLAGALIPWWRTQAYYDSAAWRGTFALDGGGAVMNQGIHTIDLLLWFLGAPKRVSATAGLVAHDGIEVEDIAAGWIEFANGCRATLASSTACWSGTGFPAEIRIHGTTGAAVLRDDKLTAFEFEKPRPSDAVVIAPATEGGGAGANDPKAIGHAWHRSNLEDAIAAIRAGKQPAVNGAEGRKAVELILALYQSAQNGGAPVELALTEDPILLKHAVKKSL